MGDIRLFFEGMKKDLNCYKFFSAIKDFQGGQRVLLDLNHIKFLTSQEILYIFLTAQKIYRETKSPIIVVNMDKAVYTYLKRIDFFNYSTILAKEQHLDLLGFMRNKQSKTVIEITKIDNPLKISSTMEKTREILNSWYGNPVYVNNIINILMELCGNSIEHSSEDEGEGECYYLLQKYKSGKCGVSIAIGDIGIGIKNHLIKVHPFKKNADSYYIIKAIQGLTGRSDGGGGMGLQRVQGIVKEFQGKLTIRSGNGIVYINSGTISKATKNYYFPGTQCIVELPFLIA